MYLKEEYFKNVSTEVLFETIKKNIWKSSNISHFPFLLSNILVKSDVTTALKSQ